MNTDTTSMQKEEYAELDLTHYDEWAHQLNEMARGGWTLVTIKEINPNIHTCSAFRAILKRQVDHDR